MKQEQQESQAPIPQKRRRKNRTFRLALILIVLLAVLGGGYFFYSQYSSGGVERAHNEDVAVAVVNDIEILDSEVSARIERNRETLEGQGNDLSDTAVLVALREQIINQLINETLILEDARVLGVVVEDSEVDVEYQNIRSRFLTEDIFKEELAKNLFTEDSLRANVRRELLTQRYVEQFAETQEIEVTEAEVLVVYEEIQAEDEDAPALEESRAIIEEQIRNQKLGELLVEKVNELRANATITLLEQVTEA